MDFPRDEAIRSNQSFKGGHVLTSFRRVRDPAWLCLPGRLTPSSSKCEDRIRRCACPVEPEVSESRPRSGLLCQPARSAFLQVDRRHSTKQSSRTQLGSHDYCLHGQITHSFQADCLPARRLTFKRPLVEKARAAAGARRAAGSMHTISLAVQTSMPAIGKPPSP